MTECWSLQMDVGILLGKLLFSKTSSCLNWYDQRSNVNCNLSPLFLGHKVAAMMKNVANHSKFHSQVEVVYVRCYVTTLLTVSVQ